MDRIDVSSEIYRFREHLNENERTILSAHFGDGKTWFLNEFIESHSNDYEFIVLYPVNYQIAPNEAIMEYIKRDILFQLILKGHLNPGVEIPDPVLFQWYISQKASSLFLDVIQVFTSLPDVNPKWKAALSTLFTISKEIVSQIKKFKDFKNDIDSEEDFNKAAQIIERLSSGAGNIYELDIISYLIIRTLQQIKNSGKQTVLIIEDLDRIDPAHLFRILNVFSAHIDRVYQCSDRLITDRDGNEIPVDTLHNKFGFDKVIMVLDNDTTRHIFSHFYGEHANYMGYISKFISHNVFYYSVMKVALQQLNHHLTSKCGVTLNMILSKGHDGEWYVKNDDLTVRKIAQVLDSFDSSISHSEEVIEGTQACFNVSTPLTRTISTLRRLGMLDDRIFMLLSDKLRTPQLLELMGGFLMKQPQSTQSYRIYYSGVVYDFHVDNSGGNTLRFGKIFDVDMRNPGDYKFVEVNIYDAFIRACKYVK